MTKIVKENAYKLAGVDIEAGDNLVKRIKPHTQKTSRSGLMGGIGGFGAFFDLHDVSAYKRPVLVSSTDGVGTKLKVALELCLHDSIGIDCVGMCVNDIIVHGAEPLYFLDYYACGKLNVDVAEDVVKGIAEGCVQAGCALIGGETAEMPGMYSDNDYDVAGFTVGVVEKEDIIDGSHIRDGDVILGLGSNGLHSNGFSLVRKIVSTTQGVSYDMPVEFSDNQNLGNVLLSPTRIYVQSVLKALHVKDDENKAAIRGMAHITGGGIIDNVKRIMPKGLCAQIDASSWKSHAIFRWLQDHGRLDNENMLSTFNCGLGLVVVVNPALSDQIVDILSKTEDVFVIGTVEKSDRDNLVEIHNMQALCQNS